MKFKITAITEWDEDFHQEAGDCSHMGDGDVMRLKLGEYEEKVENGKWPGLPFSCEADSEEEAVDKYNAACCEYDYYKAAAAEFEDAHEWEPFTLKQLMCTADEGTLFRVREETGDDVRVVLNEDFANDDPEVLNLLYPYLDRKVYGINAGVSEDPISPKNTLPTIWVDLKPEKEG